MLAAESSEKVRRIHSDTTADFCMSPFTPSLEHVRSERSGGRGVHQRTMGMPTFISEPHHMASRLSVQQYLNVELYGLDSSVGAEVYDSSNI